MGQGSQALRPPGTMGLLGTLRALLDVVLSPDAPLRALDYLPGGKLTAGLLD